MGDEPDRYAATHLRIRRQRRPSALVLPEAALGGREFHFYILNTAVAPRRSVPEPEILWQGHAMRRIRVPAPAARERPAAARPVVLIVECRQGRQRERLGAGLV